MKYIAQAKIEQQSGRTVTMRATVYNVESASGIVVLPGAFRDSLDSFVRDGYLLYQHDRMSLPLGHIVAVDDADDALVVTAEWYDHSYASDVRSIVEARLQAGRGVDVSIGYYVQDDDVEYRDGRTYIRRGELVECSIVLWGDNPEAEVIRTQSLADEITTTDDMIAASIYAVHHLARRVSAIAQLRAQDGRTVSKVTIQRMKSLSQRIRQLQESLAQVASELQWCEHHNERLEEAKAKLRAMLDQLQTRQ